MPQNKDSQFSATDLAFSIVRFLTFLGALGWIMFHPLPPREKAYLFFLTAGFFVYTIILYYLIFRFPRKSHRVYFIELILDLALLSFILPMTGGFNSSFAFAFYLVVAIHSFYYGLFGSIGVAVLSSAVYIFSCPHWPDWPDAALRVVFLFLIAVTLGFLSERERWMHGKLLRAEQLAVMGTMSSQVAHSLRNPLSTISLNAELLSDELKKCVGADTAEANALINSIMNEVGRLNGVVEEYLQFARQPKLERASCDINGLLSSLIKFFDKDAVRRNIRFLAHFEENLPKALIDERQLRQALVNIFRNSFDAMPRGGEISMFTRKLKNEIEIKVEDTGVGISKENLRKIFEPLFSTKHMGMGLGLTIARDIVVEHGGGISCESKEEKGTTIKISLPISE